jgi:hypothetical protein
MLGLSYLTVFLALFELQDLILDVSSYWDAVPVQLRL